MRREKKEETTKKSLQNSHSGIELKRNYSKLLIITSKEGLEVNPEEDEQCLSGGRMGIRCVHPRLVFLVLFEFFARMQFYLIIINNHFKKKKSDPISLSALCPSLPESHEDRSNACPIKSSQTSMIVLPSNSSSYCVFVPLGRQLGLGTCCLASNPRSTTSELRDLGKIT